MSATKLKSHQTGTSLVSLMVGLVISSLVGLAALGSVSTFSFAQKQAVGTESSWQTATLLSSSLRQELSRVGRGLAPLLACSGVNLAVDGTVLLDGKPVAPLGVTFSEEGELQLDLWYGEQLEGLTPVPLGGPVAGDLVKLGRRAWVQAGQAVLLAPAAGAVTPCEVRSVTAVNFAADGTDQSLVTGMGGPFNGGMFATAGDFTAAGTVSALGTLTHTRIWLDGTQLRMEQPMEKRAAVLASDVVGFSVQWGVQSGAAEQLRWVAPVNDDASGENWSSLDAERLSHLRAVRLGIVVRAGQSEKVPGKPCDASTSAPTLFGAALPVSGEWQCYRYRSSTVTVPLRNLGV